LEFPPLPPELQIINPVVVKPIVPKPAEIPPPPIGPNLIVHGIKTLPVEQVISNPPPAVLVLTNSAASTNPQTNAPSTPAISQVTNTAAANTNLAAAAISSGTANNLPSVTVEETATGKSFWIVGLVASVAAAGLAWVLIRRSRSQPRISLITRSLERDKK
jgi:hypothetical protein